MIDKRCPPGKTPAVICKSLQPPQRKHGKADEVKRLKVLLAQLELKHPDYLKKKDSWYKNTNRKFFEEDPSKLPKRAIKWVALLFEVQDKVPQFITFAVTEMTKLKNIEAFQDPEERYNEILRMSGMGLAGVMLPTKKTVIQLTLFKHTGRL